ncbi:hypothetical protein ACFL10_02095 [Patescibacteria group bacterium]
MDNEPTGEHTYEFQAHLLGMIIPNGFNELLNQYIMDRSTQIQLAQSIADMFINAGSSNDDKSEFMGELGEYIKEYIEKYYKEMNIDKPEAEINMLKESLLADLFISIMRRSV